MILDDAIKQLEEIKAQHGGDLYLIGQDGWELRRFEVHPFTKEESVEWSVPVGELHVKAIDNR